MLRLSEAWRTRVEDFEVFHRNRWNRRCHLVGMPMIAAAIPLGASLVGLPLAVPLLVTGWALNFAGHWVEGSPPAMVARARRKDVAFDPRNQLAGPLWWLCEVGLVER